MRRYVILFALLAVVLAACRVESNIILDINEDGSATVGAEVGFDDEFLALITESGGSPEDLFSDLPNFGDDVVTTERTEGDMTYFGVVGEVDDLSTLEAGSENLEGFESFSYTFDESSATLEAVIAAANTGDFGGEFGIDPSTITDEFFSANLIVTMPGTVTESNADVVRGDGSLVWNIPLTGEKQVFATSETGASATSWFIFVLVLVLLVMAIAAIVAVVVSRRQSQKAVDAAVAAHAAEASAADDDASDGGTEELPPPPADDAPPADEGAADEDVAPAPDAATGSEESDQTSEAEATEQESATDDSADDSDGADEPAGDESGQDEEEDEPDGADGADGDDSASDDEPTSS